MTKSSEEHFFTISARVLQHLGAELISSDDTALYELVKNGFDAGSTIVEIRIEYTLDHELVSAITEALEAMERQLYTKTKILAELRDKLDQKLVDCMGELDEVLLIEGEVSDFIDAIKSINSISVCDTGCGMTKQELISNFLTVGTANRLHQVNESLKAGHSEDDHVVFGEKGIGRLSAMRLGGRLEVITKSDRDRQWIIEIDWSSFAQSAELHANEIPIHISPGTRQLNSGTIVKITDLSSGWSEQKAEELASHFFSRFVDPFARERHLKVRIFWNGDLVVIPRIGRQFLEVAQNSMVGDVFLDEGTNYRIVVDEKISTPSGIIRSRTVEHTQLDFPDISERDLELVGPFHFELYHYNRRRVSSIPGVATRREVLDWLDEWCGGLKVYRDGVRVLPYGQMGRENSRKKRTERINESYDDWLGIDDKALRSKGLTLNRIQTVGCVRISRYRNPLLRDQSNRQGLIENRAFAVFQDLLMQLINLFRIDLMEAQDTEEDDLTAIIEKSIREEDELSDSAELMISAIAIGNPKQIRDAKERVLCSVHRMRAIIEETQTAVEDRDYNRIEVLELAGLGLSAQSFAHDLEASIDEVLSDPESIDSHLRSVFRALRIQVALIKPGAAKRRRRRTKFLLLDVLHQMKKYHGSRLSRHGIEMRIEIRHSADQARLFMVEGHFRQIIDNLVRNSLYWLPRKRLPQEGIPGDSIVIAVDGSSETLTVFDNGPGIAPQDREWVFKQFRTRRKGGKGLGLYIARELADFNGLTISLDPETKNSLGRLSTFILDLNGVWEG